MCVPHRSHQRTGRDGLCRLAKDFEGKCEKTVVARSVDHGETFEAPVIVGHATSGSSRPAPHRPASMGVDRQGRVYVVWYTEGTDEIPPPSILRIPMIGARPFPRSSS